MSGPAHRPTIRAEWASVRYSLSMRPSVRILHTSDLHLHHTHPAEAITTVHALARKASTFQADAVLIAGDVFDSANQPDEFVEAVGRAFNALTLPLVAIRGNHDIRYRPSDSDAYGQLASMADPPHHYIEAHDGESVAILDGDITVWGRGMPEHTPANDPLSDLPPMSRGAGWKIVLAHGLLGSLDELRSSPIILDDHAEALASVDYLALGHRHAPSTERFGATTVAYSGSGSQLIGSGDVAIVDFHEDIVTVARHRLEA